MLQTIVDTLEKYKRLCGRKYSIENSLKGTKQFNPNKVARWQNDYNIAEIQIEYLCEEHGCTRKSKPYRLGGDEQ